MNKFYNKALTLVELIIVIVILAILATIAFMSFESYGAQSRDSTRVTNLASITKGLGVYKITAGKYPYADSGFDLLGIVGGVPDTSVKIGSQGYIGDRISGSLKIGGSTKDPIDNNSIVYATNNKGCKFELISFLENNDSNSQIQNGVDQGIFMNNNSQRYPFIQGITESYSPGDINLGIIVEKDTTTNSYKTDNLNIADLGTGLPSGKEWKGLLANNTAPQDVANFTDYQKIVDNYNKCPSITKSCEWTEKNYTNYSGYIIDKDNCYSWFEDSWFEKQKDVGNGGIVFDADNDGEFDDLGSGVDLNLPFSINLLDGYTIDNIWIDPTYGALNTYDSINDDFDYWYYLLDTNSGFSTDSLSQVLYGYTEDYLVVYWKDIILYDSLDSRLSFQGILYKDGTYKIQIGDINLGTFDPFNDYWGIFADGSDTIGYDNGDDFPTSGSAISFTPTQPICGFSGNIADIDLENDFSNNVSTPGNIIPNVCNIGAISDFQNIIDSSDYSRKCGTTECSVSFVGI